MPKGDRNPQHWITRLIGSCTLEPMTECWIWQKFCNPKGYGQVGIGSRKDGSRRVGPASRWIWGCVNGAVPDGLYVLHTCDNPPCVNPAHLFLGTNNDNMQDMKRKGRCSDQRGVRNSNAKLSIQQVDEIRHTPAAISTAALARRYGVSHSAVWAVRTGLRWAESEMDS